MKQLNFYFLFSLFSIIFACGNNNGDPNEYYHPYGSVEGVFPNTETGRELIIVYNGVILSNKKVECVTRGITKAQAILTFENVITSEAKTTLIADLMESKNHENSGINRLIFEGVYSTKSLSIKYSGFIEPLLLVLELNEK